MGYSPGTPGTRTPEIAWNLAPGDVHVTSLQAQHDSCGRGHTHPTRVVLAATSQLRSPRTTVRQSVPFLLPCPLPSGTVPWLSPPGKVHCPPLHPALATKCGRSAALLDRAGHHIGVLDPRAPSRTSAQGLRIESPSLGCRDLQRPETTCLPSPVQSLCRPHLKTQGLPLPTGCILRCQLYFHSTLLRGAGGL